MKSLCLFFGLFQVMIFYAQFSENFSDGNFNSNPKWEGDTSEFIVVSEMLSLNAPSKTDTSYLSVESSSSLNATWEISSKLLFNPSSSNYIKIYFTSNRANLKENLNGYFVKIGGINDDVSLYRQDGKTEFLLIDGRDDILDYSNNLIRLRVERDSLFNWKLYSDTSNGKMIYEGSKTDGTFKSSEYFGISCRYTSTRSDKMSFDSIVVSGDAFVDTIPPNVVHHDLLEGDTWQLVFSEPLDQNAISRMNFLLEDFVENPENIGYDSLNQTINLSFISKVKHGKEVTLKIDSIKDLTGNILNHRLTDFFTYPDSIKYKDIIFNEIMPDPEPSVNLPESEFIEIKNRSDRILSLKSWKLSDTNDMLDLPDISLYPGEIIVFVPEKDSLLWREWNISTYPIKLPSLNNAADLLMLHSPNSIVIDSLMYTSNFISEEKENGGWSLELLNPDILCSMEQNWKTSVHEKGGSPGIENSMHQPEFKPEAFSFRDILSVTDSLAEISFSGFIRNKDVKSSKIRCIPERKLTIEKGPDDILTIQADLTFDANINYILIFDSLHNCISGYQEASSLPFVLPSDPGKGDIIINEILFNPYPGGSDFVEIHNPTDNYFDLKDMKFSSFETDSIANIKLISSKYLLLPPHSYMAFTEDSAYLTTTYPDAIDSCIRQVDLPSYGDKSGRAILLDEKNQIIDDVKYNEGMHVPYIDNKEGVSLERISPTRRSHDVSNWISASSLSAYATPGRKNSQHGQSTSKALFLDPPIFSPDNDGYNDWMKINYRMSTSGNLGSVTIYNKEGLLIRRLVVNDILAKEGSYIWKGIDEHGDRVRMGYYLIVLESISTKGELVREISTVVVAGTLN